MAPGGCARVIAAIAYHNIVLRMTLGRRRRVVVVLHRLVVGMLVARRPALLGAER